MPSIKISDQFGLDVDAELNPESGLAKYLKDLAKLKFPNLNAAAFRNVALDQVPIKVMNAGLGFEQPVSVGLDHTEMTINAGVSGNMTLFTPADEQLFGRELFGDPIPIGDGQHYLSVGLTANLTAAVEGKMSDLSFGFDSGTEVALANYQLFTKSAAAPAYPTFTEALRRTLAEFTIPGDLEDLAAMAENMVVTVEGSGTLKFSGSMSLLSVVNPLAAVDLPEPIGEIKVNSGASVKVGASFEVSSGYQLRLQKLAGQKVRLGFYKRHGSAFSVKASASLGLSAGTGDKDLVSQLLKAISDDPSLDQDALKAAGAGDGQLADIEQAVMAAVQRRLELALSVEFSSLSSDEAAFLYEIELDRLDAPGRQAVHEALDGNLSRLTEREDAPGAGIKLRHSIFITTKKQRLTLKLNLLGIFNFLSVKTLVLKGTVKFVPETGELLITDKATASRVSVFANNFAADAEKLRRVLAESFLFTAAYAGSKLVVKPPTLKVSQTYFEMHSRTNRQTMKDNLDIGQALDLLAQAEKDRFLGTIDDFGRAIVIAETRYGDELLSDLFLHGGNARPQAFYEDAGRRALTLLVQADDPDSVRRLPATDNALWQEMKSKGQANFRFIDKLRNLADASLGAVLSDYTVIVWWAESMHEMAERLAEVREFLVQNPNVDHENNTFKKLRQKLAKKLKEVAINTKAQFSDPWGLVAMDLASGRKAEAEVQVTSVQLTWRRER